MKFINKLNTPFAHRGVAETLNFLNSCWNGNSYENLEYKADKISGIKTVLLQEQYDAATAESLCCYCMRKLYDGDCNTDHPKNVTLEHIVPHNISPDEWVRQRSKYVKYGNLDANHITVCFEDKLERPRVKINGIPFPHFISYHNLVASCDGKILECNEIVPSHCCNNLRGNLYVEPLYLNRDVSTLIKYDTKGNLDFDDQQIDDSWFDRKHLNLFAPGLNKIRQLWYLISRTSYTPDDVSSAESDGMLKENILDEAIHKNRQKTEYWMTFYNNPKVWNLFSEYSWFYEYYKKRFAK